MKNIFTSEKGIMTVYVTVAVTTFTIILIALFSSAASIRKNQIKTLIKIKEVYEQDNSKIDEIYDSVSSKGWIPIGTEFCFQYTGSVQEWTVPSNGTYKLEVWGAEGGTNSGNSTAIAGKGGYSNGTVRLNKDVKIYIYVGGQGGAATSTCGGFNGGGIYSGSKTNITNASGGGGGSGWIYTEATFNTWQSGDSTDATKWLLTTQHYLSDAVTKAGNDGTIPTHNVTSTMTGNQGNGYAKIKRIK